MNSANLFQVNHSFEPNAQYGAIDHPRFGVIASVVSRRPIKKGEEIFTNYNYPSDILASKIGLNWYSELKEELSVALKEEIRVNKEEL